MKRVWILWSALVIIFLANLLWMIKIEIQLDLIRIRLDAIERQR